jgi:hypothetical protein
LIVGIFAFTLKLRAKPSDRLRKIRSGLPAPAAALRIITQSEIAPAAHRWEESASTQQRTAAKTGQFPLTGSYRGHASKTVLTKKPFERTLNVLALPGLCRQRLSDFGRGWCPKVQKWTVRVFRSDVGEAHRLS